MTNWSCIVRMQEVVESAVRLKIRTENNPLRRGLNARCITVANERGAWLMSKEDDKLIISRGLTVQNMDYANKLEEDFDSIPESDTEESEEEDTEDEDGDENVDTTW